MADFVVTRSELVGNAKGKSVLVEHVARCNALNRTGKVNYNEGGSKDGVGLQSVTEKFVDNFLLRVLVADYNTKGGKNIYIGTQNKAIRDFLEGHDLRKCIVKAVAFTKLKRAPTDIELSLMPMRTFEKQAESYYYQEYKVACPNIAYVRVMDFLRTADFTVIGMRVKDIDVTVDYAGSFDKEEVIEHLVAKKGFRVQGSKENASRTIVDNDAFVGRNCLSYMEEIEGVNTRQKIYNKMVQMLESKSVRKSVGCHWKDWVSQQGTRLADARDKTSLRGLTRVEVTLYVDANIPTDDFIERTLHNIVGYIPAALVYSTPFADVWRTYCNSFRHSLVCVDRSVDVGLIVYSYNEITGNISGESYERWSEREKWCLDKLTLNGNLPLDVIDINVVSKISSTKNGKRVKDSTIEIAGSRYYKINQDSSTRFTTRLVSNKGVYSSTVSIQTSTNMMENAGFMEHENCIPYLASTRASKSHKADAELRKVDGLEIRIESRNSKKKTGIENESMLLEEAARMEVICKPLLTDLRHKEEKQRVNSEYKKKFGTRESIPLGQLEQGTYIVHAARKQTTRYGDSYKLLVEVNGENSVVWSNQRINTGINSISKEKLQELFDKESGIIAPVKNELASLTITGRGTNRYGHVTVYCSFELKCSEKGVEGEEKGEVNSVCQYSKVEKKTITKENLLPYREYNNLSTLPVGSTHKVSAIGHATSFGGERLVIKIDDTFYQAGEDIEKKEANLQPDCLVKIEKKRVNISRRAKYAVCNIYEAGDWTAFVDYTKLPILSKRDGTTCIVDVKSIDVKGTKRKLLLTNKGSVYKLKKSKLEDIVTPGFL